MEYTWTNQTLLRFTPHFIPKETVVRAKEMHQLLQFISRCCAKCPGKKSSKKEVTIRIMHVASLPGSGKTMLLQQLSNLTDSAKKTPQKKLKKEKGAVKAAVKRPETHEHVCAHAKICMVSCASKNWNSLLTAAIESIGGMPADVGRQTGRKRKLSDNELCSLFQSTVTEFCGILILDEIDTLVQHGRRSQGAPSDAPHSPLENIRGKRPRKANPSEPTADPLTFFVEAFHTSCPGGGLVIISNHLNIHAQNIIQSSIGKERIEKIILKAYSKDDIREIITNRCGSTRVFEPAAETLLINISCDARRVLNIALEAMLHARREYWKSSEFPHEPRKGDETTQYPLVTVGDITSSCSDSGDVMLRHLRTILTPLSKDLQLLLVGIIYLSREEFHSSEKRNSVVSVDGLRQWIFSKGMELVKLQDIFDEKMFQKGINSLCDFNFIRYVSSTSSAKSAADQRQRTLSAKQKMKRSIALQYDAKALRMAIQALLREGPTGRESFQVTAHLLEE